MPLIPALFWCHDLLDAGTTPADDPGIVAPTENPRLISLTAPLIAPMGNVRLSRMPRESRRSQRGTAAVADSTG